MLKTHDFHRHAKVALIGPGRLGQALGKLLAQAGFPVRFVVARRLAAARQAVKFIGQGAPITFMAGDFAEADIILLTVSDAALAPVARSLARQRRDWSGKVVLHTCGSVPASILAPFKRRGGAIGSLHPFQTVPNPAAGARNLPGAFWGIEGDTVACRVAQKWVKALGGVPFPVRADEKTLYHAAAFLACPAVVTLMEASVRLLRRTGVPPRVARPMLARFVAETVRNFAELGGRRALTGPAVRGDWVTIRGHLRALRRADPDLVPAYEALLGPMLRLAGKRPLRQQRKHRPKVGLS